MMALLAGFDGRPSVDKLRTAAPGLFNLDHAARAGGAGAAPSDASDRGNDQAPAPESLRGDRSGTPNVFDSGAIAVGMRIVAPDTDGGDAT